MGVIDVNDVRPVFVEAWKELDPAWASKNFQKEVTKAELVPFKHGGVKECMMRLNLTTSEGPETYIWKSVYGEMAKVHKVCREGLFFREFQSCMEDIPKSLWSWADMSTGESFLVMEEFDPEFRVVGDYFGPMWPQNFGKDCPERPDGLLEECMKHAAAMHGKYWEKTDELSKNSFLHAAQRVQGEDEAGWKAIFDQSKNPWTAMNNEQRNNWDSELVKVIDASMEKANWATVQEFHKTVPMTLAHGDFHPFNIMWNDDTKKTILFDFEFTGMGSGAQDIGEFLLFMPPDERRQCMEKTVKFYHDELVKIIGNQYSYEDCWKEVIHGGFARMVWIFGMFSSGASNDDDSMARHRALESTMVAWMKDYGITPENVYQPRC
jgi:thiamine kinase-like enzyme